MFHFHFFPPHFFIFGLLDSVTDDHSLGGLRERAQCFEPNGLSFSLLSPELLTVRVGQRLHKPIANRGNSNDSSPTRTRHFAES